MMKKLIVLLFVFACCRVNLYAQSQRILYFLPDSVEVRIDNYMESKKNFKCNSIYFLLKKDSSIYNITIIPLVPDSDSNILHWVSVTNRYILINQTYYPLLFDYDFSFSTPDSVHVGEFGHREGNIKKLHLIAHRYTIFFKMNGSILKEELW